MKGSNSIKVLDIIPMKSFSLSSYEEKIFSKFSAEHKFIFSKKYSKRSLSDE